MPEPAILHYCEHCERWFDTPSVCLGCGKETVPTPQTVSSQQAKDLGITPGQITTGHRVFERDGEIIIEPPIRASDDAEEGSGG